MQYVDLSFRQLTSVPYGIRSYEKKAGLKETPIDIAKKYTGELGLGLE